MMNRKRKKSGEFVDIYLETCGKQYLKGENGCRKIMMIRKNRYKSEIKVHLYQ